MGPGLLRNPQLTSSQPINSGATAWAGRGDGLGGAGRAKNFCGRVGASDGFPMDPSSFNLGTVLFATCGLFCLATLFFGTKGGYYDSDDYDGNGTAH